MNSSFLARAHSILNCKSGHRSIVPGSPLYSISRQYTVTVYSAFFNSRILRVVTISTYVYVHICIFTKLCSESSKS